MEWNMDWNSGMEWWIGQIGNCIYGKLLFKPRYARHGLLMLVSQVIATIIPYGTIHSH